MLSKNSNDESDEIFLVYLNKILNEKINIVIMIIGTRLLDSLHSGEIWQSGNASWLILFTINFVEAVFCFIII